MRIKESGTSTVEFAVIAVVGLMVLLGTIEFGRSLFVLNTLAEATRRGVRMAAVCPINDPAIAQTAVFNDGGGANSPILRDLSTANIVVEYLNDNGAVLGDPAGNFGQIGYVRVRVVNYEHRVAIPFLDAAARAFTTNGFVATLPRESLGIPRQGAITPC